MFSFSWNKYPEAESLNHMVVLFLIFSETFIMFSIVAAPVYIPTNSEEVYFSPYPSKHLLSLTIFIMTVQTGVRWYLIVVLIYTSLMISDAEHPFMEPLATYMSSLKITYSEPTTKINVPSKDLIQIWRRIQKLYRQAKAERIQHHQTSSSTNTKVSSLDRKHRKVV